MCIRDSRKIDSGKILFNELYKRSKNFIEHEDRPISDDELLLLRDSMNKFDMSLLDNISSRRVSDILKLDMTYQYHIHCICKSPPDTDNMLEVLEESTTWLLHFTGLRTREVYQAGNVLFLYKDEEKYVPMILAESNLLSEEKKKFICGKVNRDRIVRKNITKNVGMQYSYNILHSISFLSKCPF